ncbi:MAG TPA: hypothetical protein VG454_13075 [Gemmatimonadales bacterium]|nr:hypothetical protein [Gemmatimonadales bacterium]
MTSPLRSSVPPGPREEPSGDPTLIWWTGALILLVVNSLCAVVLANAREQGRGTAYAIGAALGGALFYVIVCLVVYGIARLIGQVRTTRGRARLYCFTLGALFLGNAAALAGRFVNTKVTAAERRGLEVTKDSIRHSGFGFALPLPSADYLPSPEMQRRLDSAFAANPSMVGWVFRDSGTGQSIVIMVAKMRRVNEAGFRGFVVGARRGFKVSKFLSDTVTWRGDEGEYRLDVQHPSGVYISMRCLPVRLTVGAGGAIVCVQATTARLHELESVTSGLTLAHK